MKKIIRIAGIALLLAACDDKDDKVDPAPVPAAKECRITKMASPGAGEINVTYNAAGYVVKRETAGTSNIEMHTYTYNSQNQLIKETYSQNGIMRSEQELE